MPIVGSVGESAELNTVAHRHLVCSQNGHVDPIQDPATFEKYLTMQLVTASVEYQTLMRTIKVNTT